MQAQSRLIMNGGGRFDAVSVAEHEEVIRELRRGHQLTAQLQAEALLALRGRGQSEVTAALILQEVSSAFTVCLSIMAGFAPAPPAGAPPPPAETPESSAPLVLPRANARDDNAPKRRIMTASLTDGYEWRKYGQKTIKKSSFQRCYFRCYYQNERGCPATKRVQQHSDGEPPMFVVTYVNEHTCRTPRPEPEAAPRSAANPPDFPDGLSPQGLDSGTQAEREEMAFVSSLACVLGQGPYPGGTPPEPPQGRIADVSASTALIDAFELPAMLDVDEELDIMDYDMPVYFGTSDDDGMLP